MITLNVVMSMTTIEGKITKRNFFFGGGGYSKIQPQNLLFRLGFRVKGLGLYVRQCLPRSSIKFFPFMVRCTWPSGRASKE